jgi:hypothetical protein
MADLVEFVSLTCPNCGGKLEIYNDMDRFACSFCGGEMLVQRRGGAVSLKTVENAIRRVQVGTDKTAAELALPRLQAEIHRWTQVEAALRNEPLAIPPPIRAVNRPLFLGVAIIVIASVWVLIVEWSTVWALHDPSLRIELWVAASIAFLLGIWIFRRGCLRWADYKADSAQVRRQLEDARLKRVNDVGLQIERLRIQMHDNRQILDS